MKKLFTSFILVFLPMMASAQAVEINGIYYNLNAEYQIAEVTNNPNRYSGEVVIPTSVKYEEVTYSVASIGESAFDYCSGMTAVTIPNSVISIGNGAFGNCSGLTSLTIPSSVTYIGYYVFNHCSGLTSIVVEAGNTVYDSRDNCNAIIKTESNTLIRGCETTTFPSSVTAIDRYAFTGCSGLTSVTIPKGVTSIETSAFTYCNNLTSIVVEAGNTVFDSRDNCNAIIRTKSNDLIAGCKTTVIPNGVVSIAYSAFAGHKGLTSVDIPNGVTRILGSAFHMCSGLASVTIPNSVTSIGANAFYNCSSLTSVVIPNGVTILDNVFNGCTGLTSVVIPNSVTTIDAFCFASCRSLTSVDIPSSVTTIGKLAFSGCTGLTSLTIPSSVTSIGGRAFGNCKGLTSVTSLAATPPQAEDDSFTNYDIPLYVPKGARDAYLAASPWNKFKEIIELDNTTDDTVEDVIKISSAGQSTWCSAYDLDFTGVEGLKAYTATGYDRETGTIWLTRVQKVPANEGILLIGKEGEYKVPHKSTTTYYVNMMVGTLKAITINEKEGDYTNYYLSNGDYGVGFYKVSGTQAIAANRAYLPLLKGDVPSGTRFISLGFEDGEGTTGINDVKSGEVKSEEWFTLQGQRVVNPGKGFYIKNGKKVLVK